jgi:DNA-binding transcriptional regulator PaaX
MRLELEIGLQYFLTLLETFTRRDACMILLGYREAASERELDRLLAKWHSQKFIEKSGGRGQSALFRVLEPGQPTRTSRSPIEEWDRPWDGRWRGFSFDLPETRRKDRVKLWRHLREAHFGFLQRSVWIWPHDVESVLREMVDANGIPECFCGFEIARLFLCDNAELVNSAWDFEEIRKCHTAYLQHGGATIQSLEKAKDLEHVARVARIERAGYEDAFRLDPLLPRSLWPKNYQGLLVQARHDKFQAALLDRLRMMRRV